MPKGLIHSTKFGYNNINSKTTATIQSGKQLGFKAKAWNNLESNIYTRLTPNQLIISVSMLTGSSPAWILQEMPEEASTCTVLWTPPLWKLIVFTFAKCTGWMRSPEGARIICSSSVTVLQFQPSDANSRLLRAAFWYNSVAELHSLCRTKIGYSVRAGMGRTATSLWRDTRRFDLCFLVEAQLAWVMDDSWLSSVKFPRDAVKDRKWSC